MANYEIINFNKVNGAITVKFSETMAPLAIDVPLDEAGLYITGAELDVYIQGFIPTWHLDRMSKIAAGIPNEDSIATLVTATEPEVVLAPPSEVDIKNMEGNLAMWQEYEAEKQIAKILVKFGVLAENPTEFKTTQL